MIRFVHIVHISQRINNYPQFSTIFYYYLCAYCTYTYPAAGDILISSNRKRGKENGRKSNVDYGACISNLFFVSKINGGLRDEQQQKNRKEVHRQQREDQST